MKLFSQKTIEAKPKTKQETNTRQKSKHVPSQQNTDVTEHRQEQTDQDIAQTYGQTSSI